MKKSLLLIVLILVFVASILWGCALTSRLRTDEEAYSSYYPDYRYHDYWHRSYYDDFRYYDHYYPYYYWLDLPEDNNFHPLREKLNQIKKRIKDHRKSWREAREKRIDRRKQIVQKWRGLRREMRERRQRIRHEWREKKRGRRRIR